MTRVFVSRRALGLALSAVLVLCASSRAFAGVSVGSPFGSSPCNDPLNVIDGLNDPNFIYNVAPLKACIVLCKKAANDCREQVQIAAACQQSLIGDQAAYDAATCALQNPTDAASRRACNLSHAIGRGESRDAVRSVRDEALTDCQTWLATCVNTCGAT
jgi:hypothetical protein